MASTPEKATLQSRNDSVVAAADGDVLQEWTSSVDRQIGQREAAAAASPLAAVIDSIEQPPASSAKGIHPFSRSAVVYYIQSYLYVFVCSISAFVRISV